MRKLAVCTLLLCMGCVDTLGPFVQDVSVTRSGNLRVTKCEVKLNHVYWWLPVYSDPHLETGNCTTETVHAKRSKEED